VQNLACLHANDHLTPILSSSEKDRLGLLAGTCEHYMVLRIIDISRHENHDHYAQIGRELLDYFGNDVIFADIACRLGHVLESLNGYRASKGLPPQAILQSLLHGTFHAWYCLVVRGLPWRHEHGRMTGEETERVFSTLGRLASSLSESSLVRRYKVLTSFVRNFNDIKTREMAKAFATRARRAQLDAQHLMSEMELELEIPKMSLAEHTFNVARLQVHRWYMLV